MEEQGKTPGESENTASLSVRQGASVFPLEKDDDRSDVARTLSDLQKEKLSSANTVKKKRNLFLTVLMIVFFPITGIVLGMRKLLRKINLPLVAKMTIIYAAIFLLVLAAFTVFFMVSLRKEILTRARRYHLYSGAVGERVVCRYGVGYGSVHAQTHSQYYR